MTKAEEAIEDYRDATTAYAMTLRDAIRLSYAAIERYQGSDDRALLAAMIVWAYQGPSWFRVGEA